MKNSNVGKLQFQDNGTTYKTTLNILILIVHRNLIPMIMSWPSYRKNLTRSDILKTMKSDFCNNTLSINLFDIDPVDIFYQV